MPTTAPRVDLSLIDDLAMSAHDRSLVASLAGRLAPGTSTACLVGGEVVAIVRRERVEGREDVARASTLDWPAHLTGSGANTRIDYLYRDAANYKRDGVAILTGRLTVEQIGRFIVKLDDWCAFSAVKVGLPPLQGSLGTWNDDLDHDLHEITGITYTDNPPTVAVTADAFAEVMATQPC